jgi:hypothetical protein
MIAGWLALAAVATADQWCARPIEAHEWGVTVLRPEGGALTSTDLPEWFSRSGVQPTGAVPVRSLPADNGIRALPVVQFFGVGGGPAPVGVEVGFAEGTASAWFPAVDRLSLVDPQRQLVWDALALTGEPVTAPHPTEVAWINALRADPSAAWVNRGPESDRFLFYEAATHERSAVVVTAGESGEIVVHNRSPWPVHDLAVVTRGAKAELAILGPGETEVLSLGAPPDPAWRDRMRAQWLGPRTQRPAAPCVMMRSPADRQAPATDHRLFPQEIDALLSVWGETLLSDAPHLVYREDVAALEAVMPVRLYTDMFHVFEWRRLGLVTQALPE